MADADAGARFPPHAAELTYPEIGATLDGPLPGGYSHLEHRALVGHGSAAFAAASAAVLGWRMHGAVGLRLMASAPEAAPGVVTVGRMRLGPVVFTAPCRVVWALREARRAGFGYGSLPGHPESGEEAFVVEWTDDDDVWLTIRAFSVAATWYARAGGPVTRLFQRWFARRCAAALTGLVAASRT